MVRLLLVFGQVVDDPSLGLGRDDRRDEQQRDGDYFQCFFQVYSVLTRIKRCYFAFIAQIRRQN